MYEGAFLEETLAFLASMGLRPKGKRFELEIHFESTGAPGEFVGQETTEIQLIVRHDWWTLIAQTPKKITTIHATPSGVKIPEDQLRLSKRVKTLADVTKRFGEIERALGVRMPRVVWVRSNITGAKKAVDAWVATL